MKPVNTALDPFRMDDVALEDIEVEIAWEASLGVDFASEDSDTSGADTLESIVSWMQGEGRVNRIVELLGERGKMVQTGRLNTHVFPVPILTKTSCLPMYGCTYSLHL